MLRAPPRPPAEYRLDPLHGRPKLIDLIQRVVEIETGPGGGSEAITRVEGHGAVVPGADGNSAAVDDLCHVMRMDVVQGEADDSGLVTGRRAKDPQPFDLPQHPVRTFDQSPLMPADGVHADAVQVVDRRAQTDGGYDRRRSASNFAADRPA